MKIVLGEVIYFKQEREVHIFCKCHFEISKYRASNRTWNGDLDLITEVVSGQRPWSQSLDEMDGFETGLELIFWELRGNLMGESRGRFLIFILLLAPCVFLAPSRFLTFLVWG